MKWSVLSAVVLSGLLLCAHGQAQLSPVGMCPKAVFQTSERSIMKM